MTNTTQTKAEKTAEAIERLLFVLSINAVCKVVNNELGEAVYVTVWNAAESQKGSIELLCSQYEYGKFNGLTQAYVIDNKRDDIPQAKYVSVFYKPV